jgi:hypothetical protein
MSTVRVVLTLEIARMGWRQKARWKRGQATHV